MILVSGASGNIGTELVRLLVGSGQPVRALVRDAARAPAGAEAVIGDLTEPTDLNFDGVNALFLMSGYPGVVEAAAAAGVDRVVVLSGSSAESGDRSNAVSRYMIETEDAVRASGLTWTILRPSAFMSNALDWAPQLADGDTVRAQFPEIAAAVIDPYDVASVAAVALTSDGHGAATYRLTGPEALRPAERVRILGAALGRDLTCVPLSDEQTRAELQASMPDPYVEAFWNFYVDGALDESLITSTVTEVTGRPARTFAQWAADHAGDF